MTRARRTRRIVLATVITLAVAATAAAGISAVSARPAPQLPGVTAQALLASSLTALSQPVSISGDVRTKIDLGLPEIPSSLSGAAGGVGVTNALSSVIGTQRFRVWSSPDGVRIQHLMDLQEQDLVANKTEAWFWDSSTSTATRLRTADLAAGPPPVPPKDARQLRAQMANLDPTALAAQVLQAASTCGDVGVSGTAVVAGRDVYLLTFTPASARTLVGRVTIAIDAQTRLPLDVQIAARGSVAPSIEAGFTSVSFDAIDPSMFAFSPPPDSTVKDATGKIAAAATTPPPAGREPAAGTAPMPVTAGSCLDMSVAMPLSAPLPKDAASLLPYAGPLFSAIAVERGGQTWLLVGSVDVATLQQRASAIP